MRRMERIEETNKRVAIGDGTAEELKQMDIDKYYVQVAAPKMQKALRKENRLETFVNWTQSASHIDGIAKQERSQLYADSERTKLEYERTVFTKQNASAAQRQSQCR